MAHDVYICYDERDLDVAKDVCDTLEKSRLRCWMKNRDARVTTSVTEITEAIEKSKVMVLLYSKNSKQSNFVNNEVDTAFEIDKKILVYQIDDSKIEGGLEFFLRNKPRIEAYPNPEDKFDILVKDTRELAKGTVIDAIKQRKKLILLGAVVLVLLVGVIGFMAFNGDTGDSGATQMKAGDVKLEITDFKVDDVRKQKTDWNYSYTVEGTISPTPSPGDKCVIVVDFYDQSGSLVESKETAFENAQVVSSGYLFGSTVSDSNNIKAVDVQLINKNNIILAQDDSQI
ncbi:toll/interleukin-1 receptor domain-containing protein [Methanobrevibacter sp.]|uniref:toll/interleukin-1 receptor domain-containing protein n=1 Tax=Methanobrevibacter sp. TaxID=66852 RepID=UPI0025FA01AD|nr:toll/interleukin-1 receptor domain-containing protein [Methanobrevibacter sp.]MBR4448557.1 toll/interleukin-1 receptor domain-containing protein [Methanobrevibacter sp.]